MAKIQIYTTNYCPFCVKAQMLLQGKNVQFTKINVEDEKEREKMIKKSNGRKTVPQIFINDQHIGGFDDLDRLDKEGKLDSLLKS